MLIVAYLRGDTDSVLLALRENGSTNQDIKKMLELGDELSAAEDDIEGYKLQRELNKHLDNMIKAKKRKDKPEEYYSELFGPLGEKAAGQMTSIRSRDNTDVFHAARARAKEMNLLCNGHEKTPGQSTADYLEMNFNGANGFNLGTTERLAAVYLSLVDPGSDVVSFLDKFARSFEEKHGIRPSAGQLMRFVAESALGRFQHKPESMLFSLQAELGAEDFNEVYVIAKNTLSEISSEAFTREYAERIASALEVDTSVIADCAGIVQFRHNIFEPTVEDIVAAVASIKLKADKKQTEIRDISEHELSGYPLRPPGINDERIKSLELRNKGILRIDISKARKYLEKQHLNTDNAEPFVELCKMVNHAYPERVLELDTRFGIRVYDSEGFLCDSIMEGRYTSGTMGKFQAYGTSRFSAILEQHNLPNLDPLGTGPRIKATAREIEKKAASMLPAALDEEKKGAIARVNSLLLTVDGDCMPDIKFDANRYRPNGCFGAEEVLEYQYALCLEHTYLFIALAKELGEARAVALKIFTDGDGNLMPHVCGGVVFDDEQIELRALAVTVHTMKNTRYICHHIFDVDPELRRRTLEILGVKLENPRLVLFDLSWKDIARQYQHIVPMSDLDLLSSYFTNAGVYHILRKDYGKGLENLGTAMRINPGEEMAKSHMIAYYSDIEPDTAKVIELSEDVRTIVNPEDLISRALALIIEGRLEHAILSLLQALQMSENCQKAKVLLREIGFLE